MNLLDKELQDLQQQNVTTSVFRKSILSIILLIVASLIQFLGFDLYYTGHNIWVVWIILFLFYGLTAIAAVLAISTIIKTARLIKTSKDKKNYVSLGISIVVLLLILTEIIQRL